MDKTIPFPASPKKIPIMEVFGPVLQGEGAMIGVQTMFVRSGGCDYLCTKCDSLHAVLPDEVKAGRTMMGPEEIIEQLRRTMKGCKWVTLSGGNPAMWDFGPLVDLLHMKGIAVAIETQGSVYRPFISACDVITVSPKGPGMVLEKEVKKSLSDFTQFIEKLSDPHVLYKTSIKIPVFSQDDLDFAEDISDIASRAEPMLRKRMYISLGNWAPPLPNGMESVSFANQGDMRTALLGRFNQMSEDIMWHYPQLSHFKILPQLHVLQYGNTKGK